MFWGITKMDKMLGLYTLTNSFSFKYVGGIRKMEYRQIIKDATGTEHLIVFEDQADDKEYLRMWVDEKFLGYMPIDTIKRMGKSL